MLGDFYVGLHKLISYPFEEKRTQEASNGKHILSIRNAQITLNLTAAFQHKNPYFFLIGSKDLKKLNKHKAFTVYLLKMSRKRDIDRENVSKGLFSMLKPLM